MKKHYIHLQPLGKSISVNHQTPLIDVLHEFGVEFPCGGKGTCGKCKVKLLKGDIDFTDIHKQKLKILGLDSDWRLACYSTCTTDITLEVDQFNHLILVDESEYEFTPKTGFSIAVDLGTPEWFLSYYLSVMPSIKFGVAGKVSSPQSPTISNLHPSSCPKNSLSYFSTLHKSAKNKLKFLFHFLEYLSLLTDKHI